jgi:hypothetical protein
MDNFKEKLQKLGDKELQLLFNQSETRLNETITTFNTQRNRLTEIIKFCIPVLGALIYKVTELH